MESSELSDRQALERDEFVIELAQNGWHVAEWERMFLSGASLNPEALGEIELGGAVVQLGFDVASRRVLLRLDDPGSGGGLVLHFESDQMASTLVAPVTANVAALTEKDPAPVVQAVGPICRRMYLLTAEGLLELALP